MNRPHQGGFNRRCGATFSVVAAASARNEMSQATTNQSSSSSSSSERPQNPSNTTFIASLKTLYSDFVVRERSAHCNDGQPLTLTTLAGATSTTTAGAKKVVSGATLNNSDETQLSVTVAALQKLQPLLDAEVFTRFERFVLRSLNLIEATENEDSGPSTKFSFGAVTEKQTRTTIHAVVREVLQGTHVSKAENGEVVVERASSQTLREENRRLHAADSHKYCHFTLYKENIDSGNALRLIAQQLGIPSRRLFFSGTKDKRAITLQRVACKGITAAQLSKCNRSSFGRNATVKVGDVTLHDFGLSLGDLRGNHFTIVLRCVPSTVVLPTAERLHDIQTTLTTYGFVNYFGPQRFGTTAVLTSDIGIQILRGNFIGAVRLILRSKCFISPEMTPAVEKFEALYGTESKSEADPQQDGTTGVERIPTTISAADVEAVLQLVPHYCYLERDLLRHLARFPTDVQGALSVVSRTTVMLYCHSVQSLMWNRMATKRLEEGGLAPIVGDLVAATAAEPQSLSELPTASVVTTAAADEGEAVVAPTSDADPLSEKLQEDNEESRADGVLLAVRRLTEADIASGRYHLKDVLLTIPGPDPALQYPATSVLNKEHYKAAAAELGLPTLLEDHNALAKQYHFHGTYRSLVVVPADLQLTHRVLSHFREPIAIPEAALVAAPPRPNYKHSRGGEPIPSTESVDGGSKAQEEEEEKAVVSQPPQPLCPTTAVIASFSLPPGAYATSLLQEFCEVVLE